MLPPPDSDRPRTDRNRPRGTSCETELWAMARFARRLEANLAVRR